MGIIDLIVEQPNYIKYLMFLLLILIDATFIERVTGSVFGVDKQMSFTNFVFWVIGRVFGVTLNVSASQFLLVAMSIGMLLLVLTLAAGKMSK